MIIALLCGAGVGLGGLLMFRGSRPPRAALAAALERMQPDYADPATGTELRGRLEVEGRPAFKDAKLFPGGAREWDWSETGTAHVPGIQPSDVAELLEHGATVVVLTKGVYERLRVCPETLELLTDRGVSVHVLQTEEAVRVYNRLAVRIGLADYFTRPAD